MSRALSSKKRGVSILNINDVIDVFPSNMRDPPSPHFFVVMAGYNLATILNSLLTIFHHSTDAIKK